MVVVEVVVVTVTVGVDISVMPAMKILALSVAFFHHLRQASECVNLFPLARDTWSRRDI